MPIIFLRVAHQEVLHPCPSLAVDSSQVACLEAALDLVLALGSADSGMEAESRVAYLAAYPVAQEASQLEVAAYRAEGMVASLLVLVTLLVLAVGIRAASCLVEGSLVGEVAYLRQSLH
jgi:hypothetical protein